LVNGWCHRIRWPGSNCTHHVSRGAGDAPGLLALDELTYAADVDPLELRLRSDTDVEQAERGRAARAGTLSAGCLRGRLHSSATKKGCDHGQSGARTVSAADERVVSCLALAASIDGCEVRTIEGIGTGANLHHLQEAVVEHDAFQCGYRTPGRSPRRLHCCCASAIRDENIFVLAS
jgi:[2Fe-2S] binding domain